MTTAWLLLLLIVSSRSVDSQSTTDDQVCDGEHLSDMKREHFIELKRDMQKILQRLGSKAYKCGYKNSFKSESMYVFKTNAKRI